MGCGSSKSVKISQAKPEAPTTGACTVIKINNSSSSNNSGNNNSGTKNTTSNNTTTNNNNNKANKKTTGKGEKSAHKKQRACHTPVRGQDLTPEINLLIDTPREQGNNLDVDLRNAKPRLVRSAIRRNPNDSVHAGIKPVIPDSELGSGLDSFRTSVEADRDPAATANAFDQGRHGSGNNHNNNNNNGSSVRCDTIISRGSDSGLGNVSFVSEIPATGTVTTPHRHGTVTPSRGLGTTTPSFTRSRRPTSSRPDSGKTSSILTTSALNASFLTTSGVEDADYNHAVDVTLDLETPFSDYTVTDFDDTTFRTLSVTPSVPMTSVEPPSSVTYPKHIGVIREESEGGFTPRSVDLAREVVCKVNHATQEKRDARVQAESKPSFLPKEIISHNAQTRDKEWVVHNRQVYDVNLIILTFEHCIAQFLKAATGELQALNADFKKKYEDFPESPVNSGDDEQTEYDDWFLDDDDKALCDDLKSRIHAGRSFENRRTWNSLGMKTLLRLNLHDDVISQNLPPCRVGQVVQPYSFRYWDDVQNDVRMVLDHLNRDDAQDKLSGFLSDIKEQLQDWMRKYYNREELRPKLPEGDPNLNEFPLPNRTVADPTILRRWLGDGYPRLDLEIPETGAWFRYDVTEVDVSDAHDVFLATLRPAAREGVPFDLQVVGEAAWPVIPENVVADDIPTPNQEAVEGSRRFRTDLNDPQRMQRRRKFLLRRFVVRYELSESVFQRFGQWAEAMEEGDRKFRQLCGLL